MKRIFLFILASGVMWAQNAGTPMSLVSIIDDNLLPNGGKVGGSCTNYNVAYFNVVLGHSVACVNTNPLNVTNVGVWTVTGGGGGSSYLAGAGLTLTGTTFSVKYGTTATTATEGNDARIGAGGTTYTAGTGLTLASNAFSVNYGTTATTSAVGNDSRIVNALNSSSPLNATNLTTGTVPSGRLPVPTASTLGGVQSLACAASSHLNAISTAGVPTCTADATGGATSVPIGGSSASRPATTPGVSSLFLQTDRNVGDQFSYYNGTAWYYPGAVDATMTRDAATGTMGVNPNSVPRLGAVNNFTASNVITSPGGIPLQLASTSPKTTLYVTNTNSTSAGTHDWDISSDTTGGFLIYDDTSNANIFARSADGTATYVSGGLVVNQSNLVKPTCAVGIRGMLWYVNGGAAADSYQACLYNGTAYTWRTITIP